MSLYTRRAALFADLSMIDAAQDAAEAIMPEGSAERAMFALSAGRWRWCWTALTAAQATAWLAFAAAHPGRFLVDLSDASSQIVSRTVPAGTAAGTPWTWRLASAAVTALASSVPAAQATRYASPTGLPWAAGTAPDPIDLATGLSDPTLYSAGGTLKLASGTYVGRYQVTVAGLTVRATGAAWSPALDGSVTVPVGTADVTLRDLTITYSGWTTRLSAQTGSAPTDMPIWTGAQIFGVRGAVRGCLLRDVANIGLWTEASPGAYVGNLVVNVGWDAPDRGHGHGIYAQGTGHTITQNVFTPNYDNYSVHCYGGSSAVLTDLTVNENACGEYILVGSGQPVTNLALARNVVAASLWLGFDGSVTGQTGVVTDNVTGGELVQGTWSSLVKTGTRAFGTLNEVDIYPVAGDTSRAVVVVHNAALAANVSVNLAGYGPGRLVWWQDPSQTLAFSPGTVSVPTSGWSVATHAGATTPASASTAPGFLAFFLIPDGA